MEFGGIPPSPTKEGCALSGLSRRRVLVASSVSILPPRYRFRIRRGARPCARPRSGCPPASLAGAGRMEVGGIPPSPHQRGLRPLWTLLPDTSLACRSIFVARSGHILADANGSNYRSVRAHSREPASTPDPLASLAGSGAGRILGGYPKPPPKRAAPSLDSPAGPNISPFGSGSPDPTSASGAFVFLTRLHAHSRISSSTE